MSAFSYDDRLVIEKIATALQTLASAEQNKAKAFERIATTYARQVDVQAHK